MMFRLVMFVFHRHETSNIVIPYNYKFNILKLYL